MNFDLFEQKWLKSFKTLLLADDANADFNTDPGRHSIYTRITYIDFDRT